MNELLVKIADYLCTTTDYLLGRTSSDDSIYQLNKNDIQTNKSIKATKKSHQHNNP